MHKYKSFGFNNNVINRGGCEIALNNVYKFIKVFSEYNKLFIGKMPKTIAIYAYLW